MSAFARILRHRTGLMASLIVSAVFGLHGCGVDSDRRAISGRIDGAESRTGLISFIPADETRGPVARAAIQDGRYEFGLLNGPFPGRYRVRIELHRIRVSIGGTVQAKDIVIPAAEATDLPPDYEPAVLIEANVTSERNMQQLNLTLPGLSS